MDCGSGECIYGLTILYTGKTVLLSSIWSFQVVQTSGTTDVIGNWIASWTFPAVVNYHCYSKVHATCQIVLIPSKVCVIYQTVLMPNSACVILNTQGSANTTVSDESKEGTVLPQ